MDAFALLRRDLALVDRIADMLDDRAAGLLSALRLGLERALATLPAEAADPPPPPPGDILLGRAHADAPAQATPPPGAVTPAAPDAAPAPQGLPRSIRTPERDAALREAWGDASLTLAAVVARLNALPGRQISHASSAYKYAAALGLTSARTSVNGPPPRPGPAYRTPDRAELLRRHWMRADKTASQILAAMNTLAGPPVPQKQALYPWAAALGLPTVRPLPGEGDAAPEAAPAPAPEPPPCPKPAESAGRYSKIALTTPKPHDALPDDPLASLPAEDLEEAREMMRSGKIGARDLAEYFGWDQAAAIRIAAAIRDEQALAGRAA